MGASVTMILQRITSIAREVPDTPAVVGFDRAASEWTLTWAHLERDVRRIAARLGTIVAASRSRRHPHHCRDHPFQESGQVDFL